MEIVVGKKDKDKKNKKNQNKAPQPTPAEVAKKFQEDCAALRLAKFGHLAPVCRPHVLVDGHPSPRGGACYWTAKGEDYKTAGFTVQDYREGKHLPKPWEINNIVNSPREKFAMPKELENEQEGSEFYTREQNWRNHEYCRKWYAAGKPE